MAEQMANAACGHEECRRPLYTHAGYARQRTGCRYETRSAKALTRLFLEKGLIDSGRVLIRRVRAGHWQRAAGAWSWYACHESAPWTEIAGSQWSVAEILAAAKGAGVIDRRVYLEHAAIIEPAPEELES